MKRSAWGARPPRSRTPLATGMLNGVAVHWSAGAGSAVHAACDDIVRGIQAYHMDTHTWADVAYNHLVCRHGYVFEGRGFGWRSAAQGTNDGNSRYHAVCYIGDASTPLTVGAKQALGDLIRTYQKKYPRARDVQPHSHFTSTSCPGARLHEWIEQEGWEDAAANRKRLRALRDWILRQRGLGRPWAWIKRSANWREFLRRGGK